MNLNDLSRVFPTTSPNKLPIENEAAITVRLPSDPNHTYISKLKKEGITRGQKFLIADSAARIAKEIADPLGPPWHFDDIEMVERN